MNPSDQYQAINTLQVGDILSAEFIANHSLANEGKTDDGKLVYTATSADSSQPHIIHTDPNNRVLFVQLTLPVSEYSIRTTEAKELGVPEITTSKSSSEILWAFPTKGVSYIFNGYSQVVRKIQKYEPAFSDAYMEAIGNNYTPQESMPPITAKDRLINTYQQNPLIIISPIVGFLILLALIIFLKRKIKKI